MNVAVTSLLLLVSFMADELKNRGVTFFTGYVSSSHSGVFSFSPRTTASSRLPTMVNIRSSARQTTSSPVLSSMVHVTHSPVRSLVSEGGIPEQSVPHVSSTGTSEHAENKGIICDVGSDASSPRMHLNPEVSFALSVGCSIERCFCC